MNFGEILSRAWQIFWKHKIMWVFGILAGCSSTNSGTSSLRYTFESDVPPRVQYFFNNTPGWVSASLIGLVILFIVVAIILAIFLSTIGRVGVIRGALQADQETMKPEFSELFNGSTRYFWRVFGLNLLVGLSLALIFIIFIVAGVLGSIVTLGLGLLCFIPMLCLLIPISWVISVVLDQANIAIVVEDLGILPGLQRAWEVVKNNAGNYIVMALILVLGVGLIGGLIIGLPAALVVVPAALGSIAGSDQSQTGGFLVSVLCIFAYLPIALFLNGLLQTYIKTAWTLTFLRLTDHPAVSQPVLPSNV
jgi:hypothetical protein